MKKFDKFSVIRILSVILIVLILNLCVSSVYNVINQFDEDSEKIHYTDDYISSSLKGLDSIDVLKTNEFYNTYNEFMLNLIKRIPLGDGSKEAYKKYCKQYDQNYVFMNKYVADREGLSNVDGRVGAFQIKEWITEGKITLTYLGKHSHGLFVNYHGERVPAYAIGEHSMGDGDACYLGENGICYDIDGNPVGTGELITRNGRTEVYLYDFDYENEYDYERATTPYSLSPAETTYATVSPEISADSSYAYVTNILNYSFGMDESVNIVNIYDAIPDKIEKKAGDSPIVQICNNLIDGVLYDGFYTINFTPSYINDCYDHLSFFADLKYSSYKEFKQQFNYYNSYIADYSNFKYYVLDNETKQMVCANVSNPSDVTNLSWYSERDTKKGIVDKSDSYDGYYSDDNPALLKSSENYTIYTGINPDLPENDKLKEFVTNYYEYHIGFKNIVTKTIIRLAFLIVAFAVLAIFTGRRSYDKELHMHSLDKIYTSLRWLFDIGIICGIIYLVIGYETDWWTFNRPITFDTISIIGTSIVSLLICDVFAYSLRHIKNRTFFKNFITGHIVCYIIRKIKERKNLPDEYKDALVYIRKKTLIYFIPAFVTLCLILLSLVCEEFAIALILTMVLSGIVAAALIFIIRYASSIRTVLSGVNELSNGNYDVKVETTGMYKPVRFYAKSVNKVSDGIKDAVEEAVKQQNTKTELITNISHDLKTPLTSVINYVELLKKTNVTDEKAKEYIDILGEKSSRLKRLIEDLVEASKATTGNIDVELMKMSFTELTKQICGEYEDEMAAAGLELVSTIPVENYEIMADQRMIYRILDNLMNNARKYSQRGTRVYVSLERREDKICFIIKNISSAPLNITAEELRQRFVRGDISRTTDGSGLGLSIASDFAKLMDSNLEINISGDMFEAVVSFEICR